MKKFWFFIAIVLLILNLGLIYFFVFKGSTSGIEDHRVIIELNKVQRDYAMLEMRGFLESVQKIHSGLINRDYEEISEGALWSGKLLEGHAPPGMMRSLPFEFKKIGIGTHDMFSRISKLADQKADMAEINKTLNSALTNCVACHRLYTIQH